MATHFYVSDFSLGDRSECRRRAHRWNTRCRKGAELTSADIRCYRRVAVDHVAACDRPPPDARGGLI